MARKTALCRICFNINKFATNMLNAFLESENYTQLYEFCSGYPILDKVDGVSLPIDICIDCEKELLLAVTFRKKCLEAESRILDLVQNAQTKNDVKEKSEELLTDECIIIEDEYDEVPTVIEIAYKDPVVVNQEGTSIEETSEIDDEMVINEEHKNINSCTWTEGDKEEVVNVTEICDIIEDPETKQRRAVKRSVKELNGKSIECDLCHQTFPDHIQLNTHMKATHPDQHSNQKRKKMYSSNTRRPGRPKLSEYVSENTVLCTICGKTMPHTGLKTHLKGHEISNKESDKDGSKVAYEERKYMCEHCPKRFLNKHHLQIHIQAVHLNIKNKECPYCDEKFYTISPRDQHIADAHTGEYKYPCMVCDKNFVDVRTFRRHMLQHKNERHFECPKCDKKFYTNSNLQDHIKTHSDERNFKCDQCGKGYKTKKQLNKHVMFHKLEKNYECPLCPAAYYINQALRNHIKVKHQEYELPPPGTIMNKKRKENLEKNIFKTNIIAPCEN